MKKLVFTVKDDFIELNRLLKAVNICHTGGEAGFLVTEGKVMLNGIVETRKRAKIRTGDKVEVGGFEVVIQ